MIKQENTLKKVSRFTDCTDGVPEELPYIRRNTENDVYYFADTSRSSSRDYAKVTRTKSKRILLGVTASLLMIYLAWLAQNYFSQTLSNLGIFSIEEGEQLPSFATSKSESTNPPSPVASPVTSSVTSPVANNKGKSIPADIILNQIHSASFTLPTPPPYAPPLPEIISHQVSKKDNWSSVFESYKLDPSLAKSVLSAIQELNKTDKSINTKLKVGSEIVLNITDKRDIEKISLELDDGKLLLLEPTSPGKFKASVSFLPRHFRQYVATGRITSSLAGDAAKVGVSYDIIDDFVDMFSDRVVFHQDLHPGDRFTIIFEDEVLDDGTSLGKTSIVAASLLLQGERMAAIRYRGKDNKIRFFNEKGELLGDNFLRYPLKFSRISSLFSDNRMHPVLNVRMPHNGVDFVAPIGTPIRSVAQGTVTFSGWAGPCGKMVKIQHNARYSTAYCHLQSIATGISKGTKVQRGQLLGGLGATGRVTGAHLHYAFFDNDKFVDPLKMKLPTIDLLEAGMRIEKTYLTKAMQTIENYQQIEGRTFSEDNIRLTSRDIDTSSNDAVFSLFFRYLNKLEPLLSPQ